MIEEKAPLYFIRFEESINKKFENIDKKFDSIDKKFNNIDRRFEIIDEKFDNIDKKFGIIGGKFDKIEIRFDNLESKIDEIVAQQELHFETLGEMKIQLTSIEKKLNTEADNSVVENIEKRTEKLERVVFA